MPAKRGSVKGSEINNKMLILMIKNLSSANLFLLENFRYSKDSEALFLSRKKICQLIKTNIRA